MAAEYINISYYPVEVSLGHNGVAVDVVDDGWELRDVYEIESVKFVNVTGKPFRLWARDGNGTEWEGNLTPNESGERNIAPPQRFRSYPLSFAMTLIRN